MNLRRRQRGELDQPVIAGENPGRSAECFLKFRGLRRIADGNRLRPMLASLLEQQLDIVPRRQAEQANVVRQIIGHLDRAGADGTGAAEEDDVSHGRNGVLECWSIEVPIGNAPPLQFSINARLL